MLGEPGEAPPVFGLSIADMYTGIHGLGAVCAALYGRERTGRGQHIDMALYDCMVSMHEYAVQQYLLSDGEVLGEQMGKELPHSTVYGVFTARDGYLVLAAQVTETWSRLARLIGGEELADDERYWPRPDVTRRGTRSGPGSRRGRRASRPSLPASSSSRLSGCPARRWQTSTTSFPTRRSSPAA